MLLTFLETPFFFFILLRLWGLISADQERRLAGWIIFAIGLAQRRRNVENFHRHRQLFFSLQNVGFFRGV
jgi:hypothetical protein